MHTRDAQLKRAVVRSIGGKQAYQLGRIGFARVLEVACRREGAILSRIFTIRDYFLSGHNSAHRAESAPVLSIQTCHVTGPASLLVIGCPANFRASLIWP